MENFWNFKKYISEEDCLYYSNCKEDISSVEKLVIIKDLDESLSDHDLQDYFDKQPNAFSEYDHLAIFKHKDKTVGLVGVKWLKDNKEANILYFSHAFIGNEFQNTNIFFKMTQCLMSQIVSGDKFPDYLSTKTHNPKVFKVLYVISNLTGDGTFYPEIDKEQKDELKNIAIKISEELMLKSNLVTNKGVLLGTQIIDFPLDCKNNNESINKYFKANLAPKDQFLVVLKIPSHKRNKLVSSYYL